MTHNAEDNGFTPKWHLDILANREDNIKNAKERLQKLT